MQQGRHACCGVLPVGQAYCSPHTCRAHPPCPLPTFGCARSGELMSCWKYSEVLRRAPASCSSSERRVTRVDTCPAEGGGEVRGWRCGERECQVRTQLRGGTGMAGGQPGWAAAAAATVRQTHSHPYPPTHLQAPRQRHLQQVWVVWVPFDAALHVCCGCAGVGLHQAGCRWRETAASRVRDARQR
jgi:hypothetical protein